MKILAALLLGSSLLLTPAAWAQDRDGAIHETRREAMRDKFRDMPPEEREQFMQERREKWQALSDEEKVKLINEKHDRKMHEMKERWGNMSDQEKINMVEKRMERKGKRQRRMDHTGER